MQAPGGGLPRGGGSKRNVLKGEEGSGDRHRGGTDRQRKEHVQRLGGEPGLSEEELKGAWEGGRRAGRGRREMR